MCTVEDIRPGADGELNKKLLTQFVPADKKLSLFHSSPISPWGKRHEIVSFLFGNFAIEETSRKKLFFYGRLFHYEGNTRNSFPPPDLAILP